MPGRFRGEAVMPSNGTNGSSTSGPGGRRVARAVKGDRGRVTLQVIADKLSVSTATVSLALRDSPVVAEATKTSVQRAARELGYSYNRSAAGLRTARSNMLAVGVHDITNPFFAQLLLAIEETASAAGKTILLGTYAENLDRQARVLNTLREHRPDGMILCPAGGSGTDSLDVLIAAGIPIVQVSREIPDLGLDFVGTDDVMGMRLAVEHLVSLGHRTVAMLGGTPATSTGRDRLRGYREAMAEQGLSAMVREGFGTRDTGYAAIQEVMGREMAPTAVVCFNDLTAFGAMLGLRQMGLEAGRDVSLVGCDDVEDAARWVPPLTSIHNRQQEVGRLAADLLIRRIAEPFAPPRRIVLEPTLRVRGTTRPPCLPPRG